MVFPVFTAIDQIKTTYCIRLKLLSEKLFDESIEMKYHVPRYDLAASYKGSNTSENYF
jgi:hypothetical protein